MLLKKEYNDYEILITTKNKMLHNLILRLPNYQKENIRKFANREGKSMTEYIKNSVNFYEEHKDIVKNPLYQKEVA